MNRASIAQRLGVAALMAAVAGCAALGADSPGPPTVADAMRGQAAAEQAEIDQMTELAEQWEQGAQLVESGGEQISEGEQLIESAENDLQTGRERIEQGTRDIAEGERLQEESEQRFRELYPDASLPGEDFE